VACNHTFSVNRLCEMDIDILADSTRI